MFRLQLFFGIYLSTQVFEEPRLTNPTLHKQAQLANFIRSEMEQQMAALRVQRALRHNVPPAADNSYGVGDRVLVFREKQVKNRIGEWLEQFSVMDIDMDRKLIHVQIKENENPKAFNLAQVRKYMTATESKS